MIGLGLSINRLSPIVGTEEDLLLNLYGANIASAYSLRKLDKNYAGYAIKVRRSTDNEELDIGFVDGNLDESAISLFKGIGDAFVVTMYDQSGNDRHLQQATAARQPIIVTGSLFNDRQYMGFLAATQQFMTAEFANINQPLSRFLVGQASNVAATRTFIDGFSGSACLFQATATNFVTNAGSNLNAAASDLLPHQFTVINNGANSHCRLDGVGVTGAGGSNAMSGGIVLGANRSGANFLSGSVTELLVYSADKNADMAAIEANQIAYWG